MVGVKITQHAEVDEHDVLEALIRSTDPRTALVVFGNALFSQENLVKWSNNGWSLREHKEKFAKFMKESYADDRFVEILTERWTTK